MGLKLLSLLYRLKNWLTSLFNSGRMEREMEIEMEHHLENARAIYEQEGMREAAAKKAALRGFGNVELLKEDTRDSWGIRLIGDFLADIRLGWKQTVTNRRTSLVIIVTLGLCIGLNTAIFSMLNSYLFVRYPDYEYTNSDSLVRVCSGSIRDGRVMMPEMIPLPVYNDLEEAGSLSEIGISRWADDTILLNGSVHSKPSVPVSPSLFRTLGVQPLMGRWFDEEEKHEGQHRVVILSYSFWQSDLKGDPDILEKYLEINEESFQVVGVMPEGFYFVNRDACFWRPLVFDMKRLTNQPARMTTFSLSVARLKPGVTRAQAQAELNAITSRSSEYGPNTGNSFTVDTVSLEDYYYDPDARPKQAIFLLQGSALLVLLIGCFNITNLLLARLNVRSREVALRAMLGAGRGRIARMLLTESFLYCLAGCLLSFFVGYLCIELIRYFDINIVNLRGPLRLDRTVLAFMGMIALTCSFAIGLLPLLLATKLPLNSGKPRWRANSFFWEGRPTDAGHFDCVPSIDDLCIVNHNGNVHQKPG